MKRRRGTNLRAVDRYSSAEAVSENTIACELAPEATITLDQATLHETPVEYDQLIATAIEAATQAQGLPLEGQIICENKNLSEPTIVYETVIQASQQSQEQIKVVMDTDI